MDSYFAFVTISFFTIISPGAAILLAINNGIKYDIKAVLFSTLGNALGLFILSFVAILGVGAILKISDYFFVILKIVGALYLIYLGLKQIFSKKFHFDLKNSTKSTYERYKVFKEGFLVAVTNPKPILFFSAIFPLFMQKNESVLLQFLVLTCTFISISIASLMSYGSMSRYASYWFLDDAKVKIFYKISGFLFVLMGIGMMFLKR